MIARIVLRSMRQERDEPLCAFGAESSGQTSACKFTQLCPGYESNVICIEAMIEEALCRGLKDSDIHMDLLGESGYDVGTGHKFVEARESRNRSVSHLLLPRRLGCLYIHILWAQGT